jgi:hypothetical protein
MSLRRAWDFGLIHDHARRKASERATHIEESDGPVQGRRARLFEKVRGMIPPQV